MPIKKRRLFDQQLEAIEREAGDGLQLLDALGAREFDTESLFELLVEARHRLHLFDRLLSLIRYVGATSAGWAALFAGAWYFRILWLAMVGAVGATLTVTFFFVGGLWLLKKFKSRGDLEFTILHIEEELYRRKRTQDRNRV